MTQRVPFLETVLLPAAVGLHLWLSSSFKAGTLSQPRLAAAAPKSPRYLSRALVSSRLPARGASPVSNLFSLPRQRTRSWDRSGQKDSGGSCEIFSPGTQLEQPTGSESEAHALCPGYELPTSAFLKFIRAWRCGPQLTCKSGLMLVSWNPCVKK